MHLSYGLASKTTRIETAPHCQTRYPPPKFELRGRFIIIRHSSMRHAMQLAMDKLSVSTALKKVMNCPAERIMSGPHLRTTSPSGNADMELR